MPPLSRIDATRFLSGAVRDAGGAFAGKALESLADACGPLPYKMQLVGHYAWLAADAPMNPIDESAAGAAVREAEQIMHERVAMPAWHGLNESERSYLRCLNGLGGVATLHDLAANLDLHDSTRARTHLHLANKGCIETLDDGTIALTDVIPAGSLQQIQRLETALQASAQTLQRVDAASAGTMRPRRRPQRRPPVAVAGPHGPTSLNGLVGRLDGSRRVRCPHRTSGRSAGHLATGPATVHGRPTTMLAWGARLSSGSPSTRSTAARSRAWRAALDW